MVTFYRRLPELEYLAPKTIDEALSLLSQYKDEARLIAGGTDVIPQLKRREVKTPHYIIDLKGITDLDYIKYNADDGLSIGALATIQAITSSATIRDKFGVLCQAAERMASPQVRNRGTIVGNISNAVPSADTAPALLTLDAKLKLAGRKGERVVNIEDFFKGPNQTVLKSEILLEIKIPSPPPKSQGVYLKLSPRRAMDLAIVGVAVLAITENGTCKDIRIALGAVAPTPLRAKKAEAVIRGQKLDRELIEKAAQVAAGEARPIDDHRASAEYRREMVRVLTRRAIKQTTQS